MSGDALVKALIAYVPKLPAALSLIGSYTLIREVVVDLRVSSQRRGTKSCRPIARTLLAMSIADLFFSLPWFLGTWMSPSDLDYLMGNIGNQYTCTLQATIFEFGVFASPSFNVVLAIFSLLMVRYRWSDADISRIEPYLHAGIWCTAVALAIFPIPLEIYNNSVPICWIDSAPLGCQDSWNFGDEADCVRGDNAWLYALAFTCVLWGQIAIAGVCMIAIYVTVRQNENRMRRYAGSIAYLGTSMRGNTTNFPDGAEESGELSLPPTADAPQQTTEASHVTRELPHRASDVSQGSGQGLSPEILAHVGVTDSTRVRRDISRAVARQAIWYMCGFFLTYTLDVAARVMWYFSFNTNAELFMVSWIFLPMQGLFNFIVFCRPCSTMHTPEGRWLRRILCCGRQTASRRQSKRSSQSDAAEAVGRLMQSVQTEESSEPQPAARSNSNRSLTSQRRVSFTEELPVVREKEVSRDSSGVESDS